MKLFSLEEIVERQCVSSTADAAAIALGVLAAIDGRRRNTPIASIPDDPHVFLNDSGDVVLGIAEPLEPEDDVTRIAALLSRLLRLDAGPEVRRPLVPGSLMVLIARARREIDLPPPTRAALVATLGACAPLDPRVARATLVGGMTTVASAAVACRPDPLVVMPYAHRRLGRRIVGGSAAAAAVVVSMLAAWSVMPRAADPAAPPDPAWPSQAVATPVATPVSTPVAIIDHLPHPLLTAAMVGRDAFSPSFDGAGRTIFFHAGRNGSALMRATYDHGVVTRVTPIVNDGAANYHVVPSPDASLIAFDSDRDGERGVYVAHSDGADAVRVSGPGFAAVPSWAPDGRHLAFVKAETANRRVWNIWVADLRGGALHRITSDRVGQPWGASWFPDGRRLAYSRETSLVILDLRSGLKTTVASPVQGRLVRTPAVSPDGSRVVFQVYHDGMWILDLDSRRVRRVLANPSAEEFRWSPDGRQLLFHARTGRGWGVWTIDAEQR